MATIGHADAHIAALAKKDRGPHRDPGRKPGEVRVMQGMD